MFAAGFGARTVPTHGGPPLSLFRTPESAGAPVYYYQGLDVFAEGLYAYVTGPYPVGAGVPMEPDPGVNPEISYDSLTIRVNVSRDAAGNLYLGNTLRINAGSDEAYLSGPAAIINVDDPVRLDTTVTEWRSGDSFVQLQAHSRGTTDHFGVCWNVNTPTMKRLGCHVFARAANSQPLSRAFISDDSTSFGRQDWR